MKQAYITKKFRAASLDLITQANAILENLTGRGFAVTLRQLYYQLVASDVIPNRQTEYDKLQSLVNDARLAGLMDWDHIVDRTRYLRALSHWSSPGDIIYSAAASYHVDYWASQQYRLEFWVEKDALVDIVQQVCNRFDVPCFSCRGYTSVSEIRIAGLRLRRHYTIEQKRPVVLHLGDHDPSGIDMSRDIEERLKLFMESAGRFLTFERIALNYDQIEEYTPPPNPAKQTDSRFDQYLAQYGDESWELDALDPDVITQLIEDKINEYRQTGPWRQALEKEKEGRELLKLASRRWNTVADWLGKDDAEINALLARAKAAQPDQAEHCPHCGSEDLSKPLECAMCEGSGQDPDYAGETCSDCDGSGRVKLCRTCGKTFPVAPPPDEEETGDLEEPEEHPDAVCPYCGRQGASMEVACEACDGAGKIGGIFDLTCVICKGAGKIVVCNHCLKVYPLPAAE